MRSCIFPAFGVAVGLLAGALVATGPADAAVMCAALNRTTGLVREGAPIRLRTLCRSTEVELDAAAIGIQALSSVVVRAAAPLSASGSLSTPALCEAGEVATGGGAISSSASGAQVLVTSSRPTPDTPGEPANGWRVSATNLNAPTGQITVTPFAMCAAP